MGIDFLWPAGLHFPQAILFYFICDLDGLIELFRDVPGDHVGPHTFENDVVQGMGSVRYIGMQGKMTFGSRHVSNLKDLDFKVNPSFSVTKLSPFF